MKPLLQGLFLIVGLGGCFGYDWPSQDLQVVKTFGQRMGDKFLPGMEVLTYSSDLLAPEKGDVLFIYHPHGQRVQNLPSGLGGFTALAHDDNLRTVVSRIIPKYSPAKRSYQRGEPLGTTEVLPGQTDSRHRLFVFDQQLGELINPFLVYPAMADQKAPLLLDVKAYPEDGGEAVSLFSRSNLAVGYWTLHIVATDPATLISPLTKERVADIQRGIYVIEAYLNGSEIFNVSLDSLLEKSGRWQIKGLGVLLEDSLILEKEWNLGQVFLNQGTNILEIVIRDFQGNEVGKTFHILGQRS